MPTNPGSLPNEIISGGNAFSTYTSNQLGYQPSTRQVSEVMAAVRRMFGDEAGVQVQDSDIIDWINDGQDTIVNRNRILKTRATTNSIAGIGQYQFPGDNIEQVETLHYAGLPLKGINFAQAEHEVRIWRDSPPAQPTLWWEWAGTFTLWPTPVDPQEIVLYYTTRPTRIANSTDYLGVPDKYFQTLVQYCLQQAYELDEDWQAAQQKQAQFEANINTFGEEEDTSQRLTYDSITDVDDDGYANGWY